MASIAIFFFGSTTAAGTSAVASSCYVVTVKRADRPILLSRLDEFATQSNLQTDKTNPAAILYASHDNDWLVVLQPAVGIDRSAVTAYVPPNTAQCQGCAALERFVAERISPSFPVESCVNVPGFRTPILYNYPFSSK